MVHKTKTNTTDHYNDAMSIRLSHFCKMFNPALHISWQKFSYYNCRLFFLLSQDYVMWLQSTTAGTRMYIDETDTNKVPYSFPLNNFTNPNTFAIYDKNIQPRRNGKIVFKTSLILLGLLVCNMMFSATFNNSSVISWWSVLLVKETYLPQVMRIIFT